MDEEQNKKEDNHEFDSAIFIGGQHLADIREIKNHQRSITFQFLLNHKQPQIYRFHHT